MSACCSSRWPRTIGAGFHDGVDRSQSRAGQAAGADHVIRYDQGLWSRLERFGAAAASIYDGVGQATFNRGIEPPRPG